MSDETWANLCGLPVWDRRANVDTCGMAPDHEGECAP